MSTKKKTTTKREIFFWIAILAAPFASSLWTHRYWETLRDHLVWVTGDSGPLDGHNALAGLMVVAVHVSLFIRIAIKKGWLL